MALVDYAGSDSESENEEMDVNQECEKPTNTLLNDEEDFFKDEKQSDAGISNAQLNSDDVLEDTVKPKEWEIKLAEKTRRKLEKKAKKAAKKEKKRAKKEKVSKVDKQSKGIEKKKQKVQIAAFGALSNIVNENVSDSDDEPVAPATKPVGTGFLSSLPAPKGKNNTTGSMMKPLIPSSLSKKKTITAPKATEQVVKRVIDEEDSDDDDDVSADFFGFSSVKPKVADIADDVPAIPTFTEMEMVGPSRPAEAHPSDMYNMANVEEQPGPSDVKRGKGVIDDERAQKLIMQYSHDIGPDEMRSFNDIANNLVDVNVDAAIGPNVKANIIKNLSHRQFAEATKAPVPEVQHGGQISRKKHQITYLANLAVSREESLKDQWADQKQLKRMGRQKYGF